MSNNNSKNEYSTQTFRNRIICGESAQTLSSFPNDSVDLVVTDPPYLINYRDRSGRTLTNDNNPDAVLSVYEEISRVLKPDTYCLTFYGWSSIAQFSKAWHDAGLRIVGHIVWSKNYASSAGHVKYSHESAYLLAKGRPSLPANPLADVQPWEYSGNKVHPTEKAVSVIDPLIRTYSKLGDLVLDPFSGSGSTAVSAALNGRDYIGIELEQKYCELAKRRLAGVKQMRSPVIEAT